MKRALSLRSELWWHTRGILLTYAIILCGLLAGASALIAADSVWRLIEDRPSLFQRPAPADTREVA